MMRGSVSVTGLGQGAVKAQLGLSELLEKPGSVLALAEAPSVVFLGQSRSASVSSGVKISACSHPGPSLAPDVLRMPRAAVPDAANSSSASQTPFRHSPAVPGLVTSSSP